MNKHLPYIGFFLLFIINNSSYSASLSIDGNLPRGLYINQAEGLTNNVRVQEYLGNNLENNQRITVSFDFTNTIDTSFLFFTSLIYLSNTSNLDYTTIGCDTAPDCMSRTWNTDTRQGVILGPLRMTPNNIFGTNSRNVTYNSSNKILSLDFNIEAVLGTDYFMIFDLYNKGGPVSYNINVADSISPVPLPTSLWLFISGFIALFNRQLKL